MERSEILIGDDVFSAEYIGHLGSLFECIQELMDMGKGEVANPLATKYVEYAKNRTQSPKTDDQMAKMVTSRKRLVDSIVSGGYDPNRYKTCGINYNTEKGEGPISVLIDGAGEIRPWDGSHRFAILKNLGWKKIPAVVYKRLGEWNNAREKDTVLYTKYPHPDLSHKRARRTEPERFLRVAEAVKDLGISRVVVLGACYGFGAIALAEHGIPGVAIEQDVDRYRLARGWVRAAKANVECVRSSAHQYTGYQTNDLVMGMSVWHHIARNKEVLRSILESMPVKAHVIELAFNHNSQWYEEFRVEASGEPVEAVLEAFADAGFRNVLELYEDPQYAKRKTLLLTRS